MLSITGRSSGMSRFSVRHGVAWVDLHALLADSRGGLKPEYGEDGVHPGPRGYRVMREPVDKVLRSLLGGTQSP